MNSSGVACQGSGNDVGNIEITFATGGIADANGFIGELDMKGVSVNGGVDGNGGNPHFFTGSENPQGNFPAIGNQDF
jgi:hypothetical protein